MMKNLLCIKPTPSVDRIKVIRDHWNPGRYKCLIDRNARPGTHVVTLNDEPNLHAPAGRLHQRIGDRLSGLTAYTIECTIDRFLRRVDTPKEQTREIGISYSRIRARHARIDRFVEVHIHLTRGTP